MAESAPPTEPSLRVGRYAIYNAIASGGMATVHLGRLIGTGGFLRTVAIKRLHAQFANDADFTSMFLDEARLASRIQHPNVVSTLDVVRNDQELLLVMEYIRGESLARLIRRARDREERLPPRVAVAILAGALHGLHAAHEALDEKGQALGLVHRDVSPQNVLVGTDGVARVLDFGVAKAAGRVHTTKDGHIKGKVLYMAPEQLAARPLTRTADIYAAGVVLFEMLTCTRMFGGADDAASLTKILHNEIRVPSEIDPELAPFDALVRRATASDPAERYPTALTMVADLEVRCGGPASPAEVGAWVQRMAGETLDERARMVAEIERSSTRSRPPTDVDITIAEPKSSTTTIRRTVPITLVSVLAALLLGCVIVIAILIRREPETPTPAPRSNLEPQEPSTMPSPATAASSPIAIPPPSSAATAAPATPPPPLVSAPATKRATPPVIRPAPPRINCDPPFVVDANGHRHFIPECMK